MASSYAYLAVGSVVGGFARYFLSTHVQKLVGFTFPYGTLCVNLIGCFLIGCMAGAKNGFLTTTDGRMLLVVGFCGAFTTFSAFMLETTALCDSGQALRALAYVVASVVAGFLLFRFGASLTAL